MNNSEGESLGSNAVATPLFVDLDGTLVKTDLLAEGAVALLKSSPLYLFSMLFWLVKGGKARLKAEIANRVTLDINTLPLQTEFVEYLQSEFQQGRRLYLATASNYVLAKRVADRLNIFTDVLASDDRCNLKGKNKLQAILTKTSDGEFDYAGNAHVDIHIWRKCRKAIVVNPDIGVVLAAEKVCEIERVFEDRPSFVRVWIKATRVYQWVKNILLGVPLIAAHVFNTEAFLNVFLAFFAFGIVASATYLLNDLLDVNADRQHQRKSKRPFAAGNISIQHGLIAMPLLLAVGLYIASVVSTDFLLVIVAYLIVTLAYSLYFKALMLIDVILLASLYTLRIVAGAVAVDVVMSSWLLAFSMFIFLNLALVKRSSELVSLTQRNIDVTNGRDYRVADSHILNSMGVCAGYLSVLVLALYVDSPDGQINYTQPHILWLLCPLLLYWISRMWMKTARAEMHDDPVIYSMRDRASWIVFFLMALIVAIAV